MGEICRLWVFALGCPFGFGLIGWVGLVGSGVEVRAEGGQIGGEIVNE